MRFFVSDTHLDHPDILKHNPETRPFKDVEEMNAHIVEVWNGVVGRKDEVYIIGDFAFANHGRWCNKLNGKKHLILGNHDSMDLGSLAGMSGDLSVKDEKAMMQFRNLSTRVDMTYKGQKLFCDHYPAMTWDGKHGGAWWLCGHTHGRLRESLPDFPSLLLDMGWDVHGRPLSFDEVDAMMVKKIENMRPSDRNRIMSNRSRYRRA